MNSIFFFGSVAIEHIQHAHIEREEREKQIETFKRQIEELNTAIARCQEQLPVSGVPITRQVSCAFNDEAYPEAF